MQRMMSESNLAQILQEPPVYLSTDTVDVSDPPPFDLIRSSLCLVFLWNEERAKQKGGRGIERRREGAIGRVGKWCQVHSTGASTSLSFVQILLVIFHRRSNWRNLLDPIKRYLGAGKQTFIKRFVELNLGIIWSTELFN